MDSQTLGGILYLASSAIGIHFCDLTFVTFNIQQQFLLFTSTETICSQLLKWKPMFLIFLKLWLITKNLLNVLYNCKVCGFWEEVKLHTELTRYCNKEFNSIPMTMETKLGMCHGTVRYKGPRCNFVTVFIPVYTYYAAWTVAGTCCCFVSYKERKKTISTWNGWLLSWLFIEKPHGACYLEAKANSD